MGKMWLLNTLLMAVLLCTVTVSATEEGTLQTGKCCSQCFEQKVMSTIFSPNRTVGILFNYLQRNVPAMFFESVLKYSPAAYTQSLVQVMEELKFRQQQNLAVCEATPQDRNSHYFSQFSNTTVNALFQSLFAILEVSQDKSKEQIYTTINFMKNIQKRYNQKMENAKKNVFTQVESHRTDFTEALAKNEALAWINSQAQLLGFQDQAFFKKCIARLKITNRKIIANEKISPYLETRALEWDLYPPARTDYKGPFEAKVNKMRKKTKRRYAKYLKKTKASQEYKDRCPRDIDLVEMWGLEPINLRNLAEDKISYEDIELDLPEVIELNTIQLSRINPIDIKLSHNYYLRQFASTPHDGKIYSSPTDLGSYGAENMFIMDAERTKVWSKIVAAIVGAFMHCQKPGLLELLQKSCPMTCQAGC